MAYITTVPTRDRDEWIAQLRAMLALADRVGTTIGLRAHAMIRAAGCSVGPHHNALAAAKDGRPWREVNYSLLRKGEWLLEQSWEPRRIVDRWYDRTYWQANPHAITIGHCLNCGCAEADHDGMSRSYYHSACDDFVAATKHDGTYHPG